MALSCGSTDIGHGSDSLLAHIAAEELELRVSDFMVFTADTDLGPVDPGGYFSRVTVMTGNACIQDARGVNEKSLNAAAYKLMEPADSRAMRENKIVCEEDEDYAMSFVDAVMLAEAKFGTLSGTGSYKPRKRAGPFKGSGVGPSASDSCSAWIFKVAVDF